MKTKTDPFSQYVNPIKGASEDFDSVLSFIADASIVLMGEASHGTHEFYNARATMAKRLIVEKNFRTIAIEGDFPDVYRINRYINFQGDDTSARESLEDFKRFPLWMWRNEEMLSFIQWLRNYNKAQPSEERVSIYGLDLYSLYTSIKIVIDQLQKIDPQAAAVAEQRYNCFDVYQDPQEYGYLASVFEEKSCRQEALAEYVEIVKKRVAQFKYDNLDTRQEKFYVQQNALLVKNAEQYYTSLFSTDRAASWNMRDSHMMEVIRDVLKYNKGTGRSHKMIVWAHNSHVGDARATQMASRGELNVGQLAKEEFGAQAVAIGFTTYIGTVSAASAWDAPVERKKVRPALENSVEYFFHEIGAEAFVVIPSQHPELYQLFSENKYLERAIGVIYLPQTERHSHYFYAQLSKQFDIIIHYDTTHAVKPIDVSTHWESGEEDAPETFPFGV